MDVFESSSESSGENPQNPRIRDAAAETLVTWAQLPDTADARHRFDDHRLLLCLLMSWCVMWQGERYASHKIGRSDLEMFGNYLLRVVVDVCYLMNTF